MRTTVSIDDRLLARAKEAALARNCPLGELIDESLRVSLAAQSKRKRAAPSKPLKTFRGTGLQPGVDLSSSAALLETMEGK